MLTATIQYISAEDFRITATDQYPFPNHIEAQEFARKEAAKRGWIVKSIDFVKRKEQGNH